MLQWGIAWSLDEAVRNTALWSGVVNESTAEEGEAVSTGDDSLSENGSAASFGSAAAAAGYADLLMEKYHVPIHYVQGGYLGLNYLESEMTDNWITLTVSYHVRVPFPIIGRFTWKFTQQAKAHRWTGYEPEEDSYEDLSVYVTPYGTAYHLSKACPYLCPSIRAVPKPAVSGERSDDGSRYRACERCGFFHSGYVFVTDYGSVYHTSLSCSGLKRTISQVKIRDASGYHACPKCVTQGGEH